MKLYWNKIWNLVVAGFLTSGLTLPGGQTALRAQAGGITVSGVVRDASTGRPVQLATVAILEARQKTFSGDTGGFTLSVPEAGEYTFIISAPGMLPKRQKIRVDGATTGLAFALSRPALQGSGYIIQGERDIQKVSRNTLDQKALKDAPATFGDSLNALTTLPSVIRTGGFLGPLIIRGAGDKANKYYIDDIPIPNPQHFGAIQSIINNSLIDRIDLYSSAFPAQYGNTTGAIIDISTIDKVPAEGSNEIRISLLSSDFFFARPILRDAPGAVPVKNSPPSSGEKASDYDSDTGNANENQPQNDDATANQGQGGQAPVTTGGSGPAPKPGKEETGYWIASARASYLTTTIPPILDLIGVDGPEQLPQYYDYQLKAKWFLSDNNRHSLSFLLFGSYDTFAAASDPTEEEKAESAAEGNDPLLAESEFDSIFQTHGQGVYYSYRPSRKYRNDTSLYSSINFFRFNLASQSAEDEGIDRSFEVDNFPIVLGLKNKTEWKYAKWGKLRTNLGAENFFIKVSGETQQLKKPQVAGGGPPDLADDSLLQTVPVNFTDNNIRLMGVLETPFEFGDLKIVPGLNTQYLDLNNQLALDPRGLISYTFPSETTLSAAGGLYQSYAQNNWFYFNQPFGQEPQITQADYLETEKAIHRSLGVEQKFGLQTVKLEVFQNSYWDLVQPYVRESENKYYINSGEEETRGFEVLLRRDRFGDQGGLYGWMSYTYTEADFTSGTPSDPNRGKTYPFEYEQPHSLKLVAGYQFGANNISARFELNSGFPYTPVVGSVQRIQGRYSQVYGEPYSKRFPLGHQLDIRYARDSKFGWGRLKWYIEVLNVYNYQPNRTLDWKFNEPYQKGKNPTLAPQQGLTVIPNFGLEFVF